MYKKMFSILIVILVCSSLGGSALAQIKYPEKPIEAVVPFAAGSGADVATRQLAGFLTKHLGQPIIIINKEGAACAIGGNYVARSKPDGYTVGMFNLNVPHPAYMINPERFTYKNGDLQPVAEWTATFGGVWVRYDDQWKTAKEFVEYANKHPSELKIGHTGKGGFFWVISELFMQQAGIKLLDVPFPGDGANTIALLGKQTDIAVMTFGVGPFQQYEAKKLRPLFVTAPKRFHLNPEVPTAEEAGYPMKVEEFYLGAFVPKGTPKEVVVKLSDAIRKVTEEAEFKEKMEKFKYIIRYRDTKDFEEHVEYVGKTYWESLKQFGLK